MKQTNLRIRKGDRLTMYVSGGGGYGDPFERDPDLVGKDVRKGIVTVEGAARDYGVAVDASGRVDPASTGRLRKEKRKD
jgi:N-methylhydantoinase B